jgi:hypothetical protein
MLFYFRLMEGKWGKIGTCRSRRKDDIKMNVKEVRCMHGLYSSG